MYRSKSYRVRSIEDIFKDIDTCKTSGPVPEKIFLCDGDALGAPMEILESTLLYLRKCFPKVRSIGIYATAENILQKTEKELLRLKELGLSIAYLGLESGDNKILHMIVKGNTAEQMVEASLKLKQCQIKLSTIVMLGVGGKKLTDQHQRETAKVLSLTCPDYLSFLTTFAVPGTPYAKMVEKGLISPLTTKELLKEMYTIISEGQFNSNPVLFRANHVSNQIPIGGTLPRDQKKLIALLDKAYKDCPKGVYPTAPNQM